MPFLEHGTNSIEVTPGELLVGSGAQATWRVLNADLAARHFTIRLEKDGRAVVRPYSPSTIVVVNGVAASQQGAPLSPGDVIAAGSARFAFLQDLSAPRPTRGAGEAKEAAYLVEDRQRRAFPLVRHTTSLGRDSGAAIPVRDPIVSRFHADIRAEAGEFVLYSMGSAGTHVNGHRVGAPRVLEDGDSILVGAATFRFTRGPLPEGVTAVRLGDVDDDAVARHAAITLGATDDVATMERRPRRPGLLIVVLIATLLLAFAVWFVLGLGGA